MKAVNLLPRDARPQRSFHGSGAVIVAAVAAAAVVVLALGAGYMTAHARADRAQQQLASAKTLLQQVQREAQQQQERSASKTPPVPIVPVPPVTAEEQPRLTALASALAGRVAWDRVLREFSQVMPSDITVSSLTLKAPPDGTALLGSAFVVQGLAFSHDSVARLMARLELIPDLGSVSLASSSADPQTGRVSFEVDASLKGDAQAGATS
ncbi:MAG TPA: PilN domain-containing protein [Gaiellaceae bacterium]|nr:PilN domain-containing protein [Gaiellaceae bacterium]